jgi:hypothetical protein
MEISIAAVRVLSNAFIGGQTLAQHHEMKFPISRDRHQPALKAMCTKRKNELAQELALGAVFGPSGPDTYLVSCHGAFSAAQSLTAAQAAQSLTSWPHHVIGPIIARRLHCHALHPLHGMFAQVSRQPVGQRAD